MTTRAASTSATDPDLDDHGSGVSSDPVKDYLKLIGRIPVLTAVQEVDLSKRIEAGLFAEHKLETATGLVGNYRRDLELVAEDGRRAKALMIESNLKLVVSIAKRYAGRGTSSIQFLDIIQEGNLGLIRAVEKFDYTKGYKFSTYASWWIRQAITRGFADSARTIRIPVHMVEVLNKLARVERELAQLLGPDLTDEDIAAEMDITTKRLDELRLLGHDPVSLDAAVGHDDANSNLASFLEDLLGTRPDEAAVMADQVGRVLAALDSIASERDAKVYRMRYGLYDGNFWLLDAIAAECGFTRERARQIIGRLDKRLRLIFRGIEQGEQAAS